MKFSIPFLARRSLQAKFLTLLLTLLLTLSTIISLFFSFYQSNEQKKDILKQAKAFSNLSVRPIGSAYVNYFESGSLKFEEILNNNLDLDKNINHIQIIDVNGVLVYDSLNKSNNNTKITDEKILNTVLNNQETEFKDSGGTTTEIMEPFYDDFGAHPFSIRYFITYETLAANFARIIPLILAISAALALISALLVIVIVNRTILSPIERIVKGASIVSKGKLDSRIELETGDELETLGKAVNNMAASLQKNIEDLKGLDRLKDEFIIIASHNLRTPLTVLKGYTSQLIADPKADKAYHEKYKAMSVSVSNLENLVEEFLSIVSLETDKKISSESKVDLTELINQIISFYSDKALAKKVSLHFVTSSENYFIKGDLTKLKILFNNLLENSIKFNKEGGSVTVSIEEKNENYVVGVKDTGIGISEKEIPLVFKKFHRATDLLRYDYQGLGLGLYLTRVIAEAHHGKIWFESELHKGSTFFVSLPKSE